MFPDPNTLTTGACIGTTLIFVVGLVEFISWIIKSLKHKD